MTALPGVAPAPRRRRSELRLLLAALAVAVFSYAALAVGLDEPLGSRVVGYGAGLAALWGVAHLAVRRWAPAADPVLLPSAALLNGIGLVVIRRLDAAEGTAHAPRQLIWTAVAMAAFVVVLVVVRDHRVLDRYRYTAMAVGLFLLVLPALLPRRISEVNGARIWIRVGGLSFQPAEVAKVLLVVFFASYLVSKREVLSLASRRVGGLYLPRARDLGPVVLAWGVSLLVLVREKDLGSSLLFFGLFIVLLYVATERTSWVLIGMGLFAAGSTLAYQLFSHVQARVNTWLDPFADVANRGFQLTQALFGLAEGGLTGTGLGSGRPDIVPEAHTDFVFTSLGEELGLIGVVALLVCYALLAARGFRVALGVRDEFGKLLATGLAFALTLQVFVVVGGVTRLIPLTGLTLPFVSYGGSSLVANFAVIALLLRISDAGRSSVDAAPEPVAVSDSELTGEMTQLVSR